MAPKSEVTGAQLKLLKLEAKENVADLNAAEQGLKLLLKALGGGKSGSGTKNS